MNFVTPEDYENFYKNRQCLRENCAIEWILNRHIGKGEDVIDFGAGTGLGWELVKNITQSYIGIDNNADRVNYANSKVKNQGLKFITSDAYSYSKFITGGRNSIFLFSINYIDTKILDELCNKLTGKIIIVHYNKPYLANSSSEYKGDKERFERIHQKNKERLLQRIDFYKGITTKLLNENFYYLSIIDTKELRND